jgi:hypothetical protein
MWTGELEELPTRVRPMIGCQYCLIWIIWSPIEIHSLLAQRAGSQYNSHFFCDDILQN